MAEHPPANTQSSLPWTDDDEKALKVALHSVPVPAGLPQRLVAAMSAHAGYKGQSDEPITTESLVADASPHTVHLASDSQSTSMDYNKGISGPVRRALLVTALAASLCGFAVLASRWQSPAEKSWLVSQSNAILQEIERDNPANWRAEQRPVLDLPPSVQSQLARVALVGQRRLVDLGTKSSGIAYRLDRGDGVALYLLQMPSLAAVRGLTSRFEIMPTPSGSWSLAALRLGDETFVLAAACTQQQMFNYISRPDVT